MIENELLQNFTSELRRGSLTLAVLGCLLEPHYGYGLLETLKEKGIEVEANTLYPLLRRLESQGLLDSSWDTSQSRPRKYYTISEIGKDISKNLYNEWKNMQISIDSIFKEEK